jgi:hypothetical protein
MFNFLLFIFAFLSPAYPATTVAPKTKPAEMVVPRDPQICQLFGAVYLTSDPRQKNLARYVIFIEPEDTYAHLSVFKENNKLFADGPGLWYLTPNRAFADHIFFVTTNRAFADFVIHYTTVRTFAGCRK